MPDVALRSFVEAISRKPFDIDLFEVFSLKVLRESLWSMSGWSISIDPGHSSRGCFIGWVPARPITFAAGLPYSSGMV